MTTARQISARAITDAIRTLRAAYDTIREQEYTYGADSSAEITRLGALLEVLVAANPTTPGDIMADLTGSPSDEDIDAL